MAGDELERGPFGQRLRLLIHRMPRRESADLDWELERGFHLQVLADSIFELNLRRSGAPADIALPLTGAASDGLDTLLIWQKSPADNDWEGFSRWLRGGKPWRAALILSPSSQHGAALSSYLGPRSHTKGAPCPVVEVFQDSPPASFFTVEKNLFVLGRVGRRLQRYAGLRRWLPW